MKNLIGKSRRFHDERVGVNVDVDDEEIEQYTCPIFQDSQGTLWIGTENGLGCYEQDKDEFIFNYSILKYITQIKSNLCRVAF